VIKGFKSFLLQGELIVIAVGLVVALAFSTLIQAFCGNIITPLVNSFEGSNSQGLGWSVNGQFIDVGAFISAIIYFVIFLTVVYFMLVVPYRAYMAKRGVTVFAPPSAPAPTKSCPQCLSSDLPADALKCLHCASVVSASS
jgi:large conductance mechanosensitive channel